MQTSSLSGIGLDDDEAIVRRAAISTVFAEFTHAVRRHHLHNECGSGRLQCCHGKVGESDGLSCDDAQAHQPSTVAGAPVSSTPPPPTPAPLLESFTAQLPRYQGYIQTALHDSDWVVTVQGLEGLQGLLQQCAACYRALRGNAMAAECFEDMDRVVRLR